MNKSIQQFNEFGIVNLENIFNNFVKDPSKIAEMVKSVTDELVLLGLNMISEEFDKYDQIIRDMDSRKKDWYVVRQDDASILTSLGMVKYHKTLFKNKETGKSEYLLDRVLNLGKHARMTEDAIVKLIDEASITSYARSGNNISISNDTVTNQTVMNHLKALDFPKYKESEKKKKIEHLYIDCDEDHVHLQNKSKKGKNIVMPKLIYVYEGIDKSNENRPELLNSRYFGGVYEGKKNDILWEEVAKYIEDTYDFDSIKQIYINGDGANWIKAGLEWINKSVFVLDKYHLSKYVVKLTSHLGSYTDIKKRKLYDALDKCNFDEVIEVYREIVSMTDDMHKSKVNEAYRYIINNWDGILNQKLEGNPTCSAESHVSHVYSDRMSSRPLGWCKKGVDKMSRIEVYKANKGDLLELVRYQKSEEKVVGLEDFTLSAAKVNSRENELRRNLGVYYGMKTYSLPDNIRKAYAIKLHVFGI